MSDEQINRVAKRIAITGQQKPGVGNTQTIYIPTEAGLPILEAGKRP